jgi:hypothetical protein
MQTAPFFTAEAEVTPENLGDAIQQAIEIEIATIPVYLYTYYSLNRVPNQNAISGALVQELTAKGMPLADANKVALDLSAQVMVYANKAGATIMSVVMEEMLHMALSSNLKQALIGEPPTLAGRSPARYPTALPGHEPEFPINLAPFSLDQLMTFLKIESPKPLPETEGLLAAPIPYKTIGQFYDMIKRCINNNDLPYYPQLPQLVPGRHYYATNNIDTVYYDKEHKARYMDADDSGDLVYVTDRASANQAIDQIVEQGEGNPDATPLNPDGSVNCEQPTAEDYDDKSKEELSHFEKFAQLYCEYNALSAQFKSYGLETDISSYFVLNVPTNPTAAGYPAVANQSPTGASYPNGTIQAVAQLISGVSSYLFVMTEACYKSEGNKQYEIFMFGIHKSMIFILNSLCGDINKLTYNMDGQTYIASATFENYPFGLMGSPKSQLLQLYANAVAVYPAISYLSQRFQDLPDVPLN